MDLELSGTLKLPTVFPSKLGYAVHTRRYAAFVGIIALGQLRFLFLRSALGNGAFFELCKVMTNTFLGVIVTAVREGVDSF